MRKKIVIIGNGPSLNNIDMHFLKNTDTISYNRAYIAYKHWGFNPTYYMAIDRNAIFSYLSDVKKLISSNKIKHFFFRDIYKNILPKETNNLTYFHIGEHSNFNPNLADLGMFWNVAAVSIQILYSLGYRKFLLIGIDGNYLPNKAVKEVESKYDLISLEDNDLNHFTNNYYGKGIKYTRPNNSKFLNGWNQLSNQIQNMDIEIINSSLNSSVNCFKKMSFYNAWKWYEQ